MSWFRFDADAHVLMLQVHVQPGAKTYGAEPYGTASLKIRVAARPVDGRANGDLCDYLAERLKLPKSSVRVVRGFTSRNKTIEVKTASFDPESLLVNSQLD